MITAILDFGTNTFNLLIAERRNRGFRILGVFDNSPDKIGSTVGELPVQPLESVGEFILQERCQIAIIAVPAESAQNVADTLVEAGIKSILCYAPITLTLPPDIRVEYIDPVIHFQHMTFYLTKGCIEE